MCSHIPLTLLFFRSLTTEGGKKSWKAFSVFFFSSSSSSTFSTTSLANTLNKVLFDSSPKLNLLTWWLRGHSWQRNRRWWWQHWWKRELLFLLFSLGQQHSVLLELLSCEIRIFLLKFRNLPTYSISSLSSSIQLLSSVMYSVIES